MGREAIILAGGLGTRLKHLVPDLPKPMAPVAGRPFLAYILDSLAQNGFSSIVLSVGYKYEKIEAYFGRQYLGLKIEYSIEKEPLGTGGAIKKSLELCDSEEVFILNGDTYFALNFAEMEKLHREKKSNFTMALKPMENYERYGSVEFDSDRIIRFKEKKPTQLGTINGGIYLLQPSILQLSDFSSKFSFEQDFLEKKVDSIRLVPFVSNAYFIDIGIPEDYKKANVDFSGGLLSL